MGPKCIYKNPKEPVVGIHKAPMLKDAYWYYFQVRLRWLPAISLAQMLLFGIKNKSPSSQLQGMKSSPLQK